MRPDGQDFVCFVTRVTGILTDGETRSDLLARQAVLVAGWEKHWRTVLEETTRESCQGLSTHGLPHAHVLCQSLSWWDYFWRLWELQEVDLDGGSRVQGMSLGAVSCSRLLFPILFALSAKNWRKACDTCSGLHGQAAIIELSLFQVVSARGLITGGWIHDVILFTALSLALRQLHSKHCCSFCCYLNEFMVNKYKAFILERGYLAEKKNMGKMSVPFGQCCDNQRTKGAKGTDRREPYARQPSSKARPKPWEWNESPREGRWQQSENLSGDARLTMAGRRLFSRDSFAVWWSVWASSFNSV